MLRNIIAALLLALLAATGATAQVQRKSDPMKPRWMTSSLPSPKTPGYIFLTAQGTGATLEEARQRALFNLSSKLEHERGIEVTSRLEGSKEATRAAGTTQRTARQTYTFECVERGKNITLTTSVVDEYWEYAGGRYTVTDLYTVKDNNSRTGRYTDRITLTTHYGAGPVFMSLIPGAGQLYKGSKTKGGLIMGGAVVCAGGIVACESMRHTYVNKRTEYPQHFDFYNKRVSTWNTARNICIGVGAALYVYNLIDAAVAPGRRRVKVERSGAPVFSAAPAVIDCGFGNAVAPGLTFAMTF